MNIAERLSVTVDAAKAGVAAVAACLGTILGFRGALLVCWAIVMAVDFATGTWAARKNGEWSSRVSAEGRWHKIGEMVAVIVAGVLDVAISLFGGYFSAEFTWGGYFLPIVTAWYIITEMGSILENTVKLGAPVPDWLVRGLKIGLSAVNGAADKIVDEVDALEHTLVDNTDEEVDENG